MTSAARTWTGRDRRRRKLVAGNWKMAGSHAQLRELDAIAAAARRHPEVDLVICPPFTLIEAARRRQPVLQIGAQDCHEAPEGAFTGCVSAAMLRESGASHVIVGHSERRAAHGETDAMVRAKSKQALAAGLVSLVCVGESEAERRSGEAESIVTGQIFGSVTKYAGPDNIIVSYEPVWAIGSGRTPSLSEVRSMHGRIRDALVGKLSEAVGRSIPILYGGSVRAANAAALLQLEHVDGVLVGGASLRADDFVPIIEAAAAAA